MTGAVHCFRQVVVSDSPLFEALPNIKGLSGFSDIVKQYETLMPDHFRYGGVDREIPASLL